MAEKIENINGIVEHWVESSNHDYTTMKHLLDSKDYNWALFIGHLVIEKLLKAVYVSRLRKHAIHTHDLLRLASKIELELNELQEEWLDEITTFNINARYDTYKQEFHQRCTELFAREWVENIEKLREWLINLL